MCYEAPRNKKQEGSTKFQIGDRVNVKYGHGWNGKGEVTGISPGGYYDVTYPNGRSGWFRANHLTKIESLGGFEVGDRVKVTEYRGTTWDNQPSTVIGFSFNTYVRIKTDQGALSEFYPHNLKRLSETPKAPKTQTVGSAYTAGVNAAREIAKANGFVTADEVQAKLAGIGYSSTDLGNAAGAIFRNSNFRKVGVVNSTRPGNRGRKIAKWELVNA